MKQIIFSLALALICTASPAFAAEKVNLSFPPKSQKTTVQHPNSAALFVP